MSGPAAEIESFGRTLFMQSPAWYFHRLRAMSPQEVVWRVASEARDLVDAGRLVLDRWPSDRRAAQAAEALAAPAPSRLCDVPRGAWAEASAGSLEADWHRRLIASADALMAHRLKFFGSEVDLGTPIAWNRDHVRGRDTPLDFAPRIDYRDAAAVGDCKIVWEPARHHQLVVLARAYRAAGDARYAAELVDQVTSWLDQCPFPRGMHWRSPLELAIRLINWTWAIDLIRDAGVLTPAFCRRFLHAVDLHLWEICRKYSRGSSANNHLIGEAAGVFIACCGLPMLDPDGQRRAVSAAILTGQIEAQTAADGGTREQAMGYHLFVWQLLAAAGFTGRHTGDDLPVSFWRRLEKMAEFAAVLAEGGPPPTFGDADDGYVLDLGRGHDDLAGTLCVSATFFGRSDFKRLTGGWQEPAEWLLGSTGREAFERLPDDSGAALTSKALAETGYYVLQSGHAGSDDRISVVVDCGPLGFTSIAAHGHADALAVHLRAFGQEVLIDPGTYDYFTFPAWRAYFRGTRAHNTVLVDGMDQSEQLGLFLWGARASAACVDWEPRVGGGSVTGEHDGYRRLADPVVHRRAVDLDGERRMVVIRDTLSMHDAHTLHIHFHLAEACQAEAIDERSCAIHVAGRRLTLRLDPRVSWTIVRGGEEPGVGWVSHGYHQKRRSTTIVATIAATGDTVLESRFHIEPVAPG